MKTQVTTLDESTLFEELSKKLSYLSGGSMIREVRTKFESASESETPYEVYLEGLSTLKKINQPTAAKASIVAEIESAIESVYGESVEDDEILTAEQLEKLLAESMSLTDEEFDSNPQLADFAKVGDTIYLNDQGVTSAIQSSDSEKIVFLSEDQAFSFVKPERKLVPPPVPPVPPAPFAEPASASTEEIKSSEETSTDEIKQTSKVFAGKKVKVTKKLLTANQGLDALVEFKDTIFVDADRKVTAFIVTEAFAASEKNTKNLAVGDVWVLDEPYALS